MRQNLLLNKVPAWKGPTFIKTENPAQVFSVTLAKFLRTPVL